MDKKFDKAIKKIQNQNIMGLKTVLYSQHIRAGAKLVDFAGWDMPLHYGSQIAEHLKVRADAGMFDVSHMQVLDLQGADSRSFLRYLLANNVDKLMPGKALYSCLLNSQGKVVDDLITYQIDNANYRLISNAGTREKVFAWIQEHSREFNVQITARTDLAIIAVQGPKSREKVDKVLSPIRREACVGLKPFHFVFIENWMIARTGYTGEEGYEIILPVADAADFWQTLVHAGIQTCGLGARDSLRLEAGLNLYGSDMDETTSPLESNLEWTVAWQPDDREFIGRSALQLQKQQGVKRCLLGLVLQDKGILRSHQTVIVENKQGEITSGGFSPTLNCSIALARVPVEIGKTCWVEMRGKRLQARVIRPPFVYKGKKAF